MEIIDLSGIYEITLSNDSFSNYVNTHYFQRDYLGKKLTATFPNTSDNLKLGQKSVESDIGRLTREYRFLGNVYIEREFVIPEEFDGKRICFFFERVNWTSKLFIDGIPFGSKNSLISPHVYDISQIPHMYDASKILTPGKHTIVVCINNEYTVDIGKWCNANSDESMTNWNGILGKMEMRCYEDLEIEDKQLFFDGKSLTVKARVFSAENYADCKFIIDIDDSSVKSENSIELEKGYNNIESVIEIPDTIRRWDALSPNIYQVKLHVKTKMKSESILIPFGFRHLSKNRHNILINNDPIYLRGSVDDGLYPGYPHTPIDIGDWLDIFKKYKQYGFNHIRFHSWCPPEGAFFAADKIGMYLQIECPLWEPYGEISKNRERADFISEEALRIISNYGNHASFLFMSIGNELGIGDDPFLDEIVQKMQKMDNRHFYTRTTHPCVENSCDDYFVSAAVTVRNENNSGMLRGYGNLFENSLNNYDSTISVLDRPVISHEVGQISSYINFDNENNFLYNLKPLFYEQYKKQLNLNGTLRHWRKYHEVTAIWQRELYKHEIEAALRSKNLAGFQLLGLKDSTGWGNASIGLLDATLHDKGFADTEYFQMFCNDVVILCEIAKFIYCTGETMKVVVKVSNFSKKILFGDIRISLMDSDSNETYCEKRLHAGDIISGNISEVGYIDFIIPYIEGKSRKLDLVVQLGAYQNKWNIWVFEETKIIQNLDIIVTEDFDEALNGLRQEKSVLLVGNKNLNKNIEYCDYRPVFWSYLLFKEQMHSYGLYIEKTHPALEGFCCEEYTEFLWFHLMKNSRLFKLKQLNMNIDPIIKGVHVFDLAENTGYVFEARINNGKLFVCGFDLITKLDNRIEARHLYNSIIKYIQSERFNPEILVDAESLVHYFDNSEGNRTSKNDSIYYKGF